MNIVNENDIKFDFYSKSCTSKYLNNEYNLLEKHVYCNSSVPVEKRDQLYYCSVDIVLKNIAHFEKVVVFLAKCKVITWSKQDYIMDRLQEMRNVINSNAEVLQHDAG